MNIICQFQNVKFPSNVSPTLAEKVHPTENKPHKSTLKAYYRNFTVHHFFLTASIIHKIIVFLTEVVYWTFMNFSMKKKNMFCLFRHKQWLKMVSLTSIVFLVLFGSAVSGWSNPKYEVTYRNIMV